jgi:RNA polymerase sigma-70 factor (ECF subfamily)
MPKKSEKRLIRLLMQHDERAFEEFVRVYSDNVFNIAFRMLGNRAEAEDISQDIFITVFKRIHTFRGDSSLSTWLYRVTVNHCKNRIKYLARRHEQQKREYDEARAGKQDPTKSLVGAVHRPDEIVEAMETEAQIQKSLKALEEDHRTILVLREIECLSYAQIGEIMKLEEGTVKSKLHRARTAFMKMMREEQGEDPGDGEKA